MIWLQNKKDAQMKPKQGFLAATVTKFYSDLSNAKRNDPE